MSIVVAMCAWPSCACASFGDAPDVEGRVANVDGGSTATYTYDAMDNRVRVDVAGADSYEYLFDSSNRRISSWRLDGSASGFGNEGRIYWDYGLLANRAWNGTTYFHHQDWQGTERLRTDYAGNIANGQRSLAFGDSTDQYGGAQDNNQFTSQDRDAETGTTHFQYRQYNPTQGSWMSADPYDGSYDLSNPQSFNRYAYVLNNPYSLTDPSGLDDCNPDDPGYDECYSGGSGTNGGRTCIANCGRPAPPPQTQHHRLHHRLRPLS